MAPGEQTVPATSSWRSSFLLLLGVALTLVVALLLAQVDERQVRLAAPPASLAVANLPSPTPRPTLALPTTTPTPHPTVTPVSGTTPTPESAFTSTAIAIMPICGLIPEGWRPYQVVRGDSLFTLSVRSGATISEIQRANCLENSLIFAGTILYLPPTPPSRPPCGPPLSWVTYVVQPGDTLFSLAVRHGTTVYQIMTANCLSSVTIQANRAIFLPPLPATPIPPTPVPPTPVPPSPVPATLTPSPMPTTATPAPTASATPGPTIPPTLPPTATPTLPATVTPTPMVTPQPSATTTPTTLPPPTTSATPTSPPGDTPTATLPPSPSATLPPTATPSPPPTSTPTLLPTATATPLPTPVPAASSTPTPTPLGEHRQKSGQDARATGLDVGSAVL